MVLIMLTRFFPPFRTYIAAFHPVVSDSDALELSLIRFIDHVAAYESGSSQSNGDLKQERPAEVAVFLAALALGAQFADLPYSSRASQSYGLSIV